MSEELHKVQGADRLKLWLEYTKLQDENPEFQVNQYQPSHARASHLTLGCTRTG